MDPTATARELDEKASRLAATLIAFLNYHVGGMWPIKEQPVVCMRALQMLADEIARLRGAIDPTEDTI